LVADLLLQAGHKVEIHDDHLPIDAPDEDWIALVARRRWIALTKDKNIRYRNTELAAVRANGARVFGCVPRTRPASRWRRCSCATRRGWCGTQHHTNHRSWSEWIETES